MSNFDYFMRAYHFIANKSFVIPSVNVQIILNAILGLV